MNPEGADLRRYSEVLVLTTLLVWVVWTVFVYTHGRSGDTISCVIMDFCESRGTTVMVCLTIGFLLGHWLWPIPSASAR